jgi:hypothetical protein
MQNKLCGIGNLKLNWHFNISYPDKHMGDCYLQAVN